MEASFAKKLKYGWMGRNGSRSTAKFAVRATLRDVAWREVVHGWREEAGRQS